MAQRGGANQQNAGQQKAQEDAKQEAEERRQMMLAQILSSEARERRKFSLLIPFMICLMTAVLIIDAILFISYFKSSTFKQFWK